MSIQFNDLENYKGLVQFYEKEIGAERGFISGNTTRLKEFTSDANLAKDDFTDLAIKASGRHQHDDSNHTDHPIIFADIVSGQRDYTFTTDETGNAILDLYRVFVLPNATATLYTEIYPVDQQSEYTGIGTGDTTTGTPSTYDKTGNSLFLDHVPGYSVTNGIKMMIARESPYYVYTDTTKKSGVPGLFDAYFYLKPALNQARRKNLTNERKIKEAVLEMEKKIGEHFARRDRDERKVLTMNQIRFR